MPSFSATFYIEPNTIEQITVNAGYDINISRSSISGNYGVFTTTGIGWDGESSKSITISASGYIDYTGSLVFDNINMKWSNLYATMISTTAYVSNLSDGTITYIIKDSNAIHTEDVTSTYSPTGTAPVNGTAIASAISGVANTDLSNLTSIGKNVGNWSTNVSNCLTEIPQDLNFELYNGTLTLKQNSKVYTKSDTTTPTYNIISDKTLTKNVDGTYFVYYTGSQLSAYSKIEYTYDTLPYGVSFPLAEITVSGGSISSINQVFNGFGYIGSTIFALPGIKGLVPNGRNADGTLNNSSFTTTAVQVFTGSGPYNRLMRFDASGNFTVSNVTLEYDEQKNKMMSGGVEYSIMVVGDAYWNSSSQITSFNTKTAFHAVDWNDKGTVGGWAMPSDKYIDLPDAVSGSQYTVPANGYFYVEKVSSAASQYFSVRNVTKNIKIGEFHSGWSGQSIGLMVPAMKNDIVRFDGTFGGTTSLCRFIYAKGEGNV